MSHRGGGGGGESFSSAVPLSAAARFPAAAKPSAGAAATAGHFFGRLAGCLDINTGSVLDFIHAFQHDVLAGFEAGRDSHIIAFGIFDRDHPEFCRLILSEY